MAHSSPGEQEQRSKLDTNVAQRARVWNYLLGGKDNFAADRKAGDVLLKKIPGIVRLARLQRRFLAGAVGYLAGEAGTGQFLAIGTMLPTTANVHEIAQSIAPLSRVVYVDDDPMVLSHARALHVSTPGGATSYIEADFRDPDTILANAAPTLDLSQPVALVMLAIMGQVPDSDKPHIIVRRYIEALPPGSSLTLLDGTDTNAVTNEAIAAFNENSASSYHLRSPDQITAFFDGLDVIPPGIVPASRWQRNGTSSEDTEDFTLCAIAFKR